MLLNFGGKTTCSKKVMMCCASTSGIQLGVSIMCSKC